MAKEFLPSKEPYPAGIPLAPGGAFYRPAQGDPSREKEGLLIFVQKGENFFCPYASGTAPWGTYPHVDRAAAAIGG